MVLRSWHFTVALYLSLQAPSIFRKLLSISGKMVRGKIEMKRIENTTNRQVTFSKRRNGLMKKAHELSVLCDAQVAVIIFSQKGRLYEFSSFDIKKIMERYRRYSKDTSLTDRIEDEGYIQQRRSDSASIRKKIELLDTQKRKLLGDDLSSCSSEELQAIEKQVEKSLHSIRLRMDQIFKEHLEQLEVKERNLREENARLNQMLGEKARKQWEKQKEKEAALSSQCSVLSTDVETQLFIGLPHQRCS